MSKLIDTQIITKDGKPAFAVIPYDTYLNLLGENTTIPHEVVEISVKEDCNLVKAWRLHLHLKQADIAKKAGMTQSALSQIEQSENVRSATIDKIADAMGLKPEQLTDSAYR